MSLWSIACVYYFGSLQAAHHHTRSQNLHDIRAEFYKYHTRQIQTIAQIVDDMVSANVWVTVIILWFFIIFNSLYILIESTYQKHIVKTIRLHIGTI